MSLEANVQAAAPFAPVATPSKLSAAGLNTMPAVSGSGTRTAAKVIADHNFQFPNTAFRVVLHAGVALPQAAARLVDDAYSRLGYITSMLESYPSDICPGSAVLQAVHGDNEIWGTLSINLDSHRGLKAEALYAKEIAAYRRQGGVCEFTRLALDRTQAGREVLSSIFYMAYIYANAIQSAKHLFIEVNPRHEAFYARMLGFERIGEEKLCNRVNAPAVLMHLDLAFSCEQVERFRHGVSVPQAALYRFFPSASDERRLIQHMAAALR